MLFTEYRFIAFFLLVFGVAWMLRHDTRRKTWLLVVSYVFYAAWDWRFLSLIAASTIVDYSVGLALGRATTRRRTLLGVSLVANLSLLGIFKYLDFFAESAQAILNFLGLATEISTLQLILPVGISFYTFQTLSYTIDIYRGKLQPTRNLLDVALFVGFFPQLVAGPIVRAAQFLPQLASRPAWAGVDVRRCLVIFGVGFAQKAVVADTFAVVVDRYFNDPGAYDTPGAWLAVLGFGAQIYGDFAGYSNMAIGAAGLLGYTLPSNFDFPYLRTNFAKSIVSWHITLTEWFRDYVYQPMRRRLGRGVGPHYTATLLSMGLVGLWHGASWRFAIWGVVWGSGVVTYHAWRRVRRRLLTRRFNPWLAAAVGLVLTNLFWVLNLAIFRAESLRQAIEIQGHLLGFGAGSLSLDSGYWFVLIGTLYAVHALNFKGAFRGWATVPRWAFALGSGAAAQIALILAAVDQPAFIYFQF